ncbi:MAG: TrkA family potassium uptake protein [Bacteroidetes bacterium]|nr:TrkA family potassium uptake protein [Bacteroidota bacterium]
MHLLIIGAGRTGKHVIQSSVEDKHDVYVIEKDPQVAAWVSTHFDCVVINADATNLESLKEAKAEKADAIIVTTNDDAVNMLVILLGQQLGIKRLVSSVNNEDHFPIFEKLGIDTVESPYRLNGRFLYRAIQGPSVKEFLDLGDGVEIVELIVSPKSVVNNKLIKELNKTRALPKDTRIIVIKRDDQIIIPEGETQILAGDVVAALALKQSVPALAVLFN